MQNRMNKSFFVCLIIFTMTIFGSLSVHAAPSFQDVSKNHWSYDSIQKLTDMKIINGFPNGTYRPQEQLTRAQGAIIIGKALNVETAQPNQHKFSDVKSNTSGYEYIHALTNKGIFNKADKFNPTSPLTRAQMAKILVHSFDLDGGSSRFLNDLSFNHWAWDDIQTLVSTGITTGTSKHRFSPEQTVTREQMAVFIHRTLDYIDGNFSPVIYKPSVPGKEDAADLAEFNKMAEEILIFTNKERKKKALHPLKPHSKTKKLAMIKAEDFYINDYFAHDSPVFGSPFEMMDNAGIQYSAAAENIAIGYTTTGEVVDAWMNSQGHRVNMLNPRYTHIGVGYYKVELADSTETYFVQMFLKP